MKQCKTIGCSSRAPERDDFCPRCLEELTALYEIREQQEGGSAPFHESVRKETPLMRAEDFLNQAAQHMNDRAATYDAPQGERSMGKTVAAFNALTGRNLSETEGWLFMSLLKMARANQGAFRLDNYEDLVAYTALMGEAAIKEA